MANMSVQPLEEKAGGDVKSPRVYSYKRASDLDLGQVWRCEKLRDFEWRVRCLGLDSNPEAVALLEKMLRCTEDLNAIGESVAKREYGEAFDAFTRANFKTCLTCKVSKPLTEFFNHPTAADCLHCYCKECDKKRRSATTSAEGKRKLESGELKYPSEKKCRGCNLTKKKEEFRLNSRNSDGLNSYCNRCQSLYHIRSKYGLNEEEYLAMHENQKGECEICNKEILLFLKGIDVRAAHVDHAHVQGFKKMKAEDKKKHVRGMLCRNCNLMIGYAKDNPKMLRAAALYLETSSLE